MTVYALWHGGGSYALGEISDSLETFPTLGCARDACASRWGTGSRWRQLFKYADGRQDYVFTPVVDETSGMHVWMSDPRGDSDPYPDHVICYAPGPGQSSVTAWKVEPA